MVVYLFNKQKNCIFVFWVPLINELVRLIITYIFLRLANLNVFFVAMNSSYFYGFSLINAYYVLPVSSQSFNVFKRLLYLDKFVDFVNQFNQFTQWINLKKNN